MPKLDVFARRAQAPLYAIDSCNASQTIRVFQMRSLLETISYRYAGSSQIPLGDCIYILDG
jgi:hypothetical protein